MDIQELNTASSFWHGHLKQDNVHDKKGTSTIRSSAYGSMSSSYDCRNLQYEDITLPESGFQIHPEARRRQRLPSDEHPLKSVDLSIFEENNGNYKKHAKDEGFSSRTSTLSAKSFDFKLSRDPSFADISETSFDSEPHTIDVELSRNSSFSNIQIPVNIDQLPRISADQLPRINADQLTRINADQKSRSTNISRRSSIDKIYFEAPATTAFKCESSHEEQSRIGVNSNEEQGLTGESSDKLPGRIQSSTCSEGFTIGNESGDDLPDDVFVDADEENPESGKIPAFDAFGETKRRKAKSYHIEERCLQLCRLMIYIILFSIVLGGGVMTKLSVLSLVSNFRQSKGTERTNNAIYLVTIAFIYPCFTLLFSLLKLLFGKAQTIPMSVLLFMVFVDILHTVGVLLLLFKVLPHLSGTSSVYLMMCAPLGPSIFSFFSALVSPRGKCRSRVITTVVRGVAVALFLGSLIGFYWSSVLKVIDPDDPEVIWIAPVSVVLISLGWWENYLDVRLPTFCRKKVHLEKKTRKFRDKLCFWTSFSKLVVIGIALLLSIYTSIPFFNVHGALTGQNKTNVTMTTESSSSMNKSIEALTACQNNKSNDSNITNCATSDVIEDIVKEAQTPSSWILEVYILIKNFVTEYFLVLRIILQTFIVSYCGTLACKLHMQRFAFALATLLISPMTLLYLFLKCSNPQLFNVVEFENGYMCLPSDESLAECIVLACLMFAGLCIITLHIWVPHTERMAKLERMFFHPLKDCIFVDYNLLLRRKRDIVSNNQHELHKGERIVPKVYVCATMWHENSREMVQLLKSLLRIDHHCAVSKAAEEQFLIRVEDPDKFEPEIHIIFDDAFCIDEDTQQQKVNKYVHQFLDCLEEAASELLGRETKKEWDSTPTRSSLPYGGRLVWTLPGGTKMIAHLKNKTKIRHRKRWSQVMYLYYLLGFKTFEYKSKDDVLGDAKEKRKTSFSYLNTFSKAIPDRFKTPLENTYILTLDGDVDFKPKSVLLLIDRMKKNPKVGAVCGRIHPIGSGPMVWYQKFEYAVGHWLQKSAEHVLGCVLCCPGCFSLFRASALIDDNVVKTYTRKPTEAMHYIQFEQGEDRWLCTLLLQQGYKIDYCAGADAYTFTPESFNEFYIQRRRWSPSTNANIFDLLMSWRHTVQQNENINRLYMAYQGLMLSTSLLAPATVTIMIAGSYSAVLDIDSWTSYFLSMGPIVLFIVVCLKCKQNTQLFIASLLSACYCIVMIIVTIGTILNVVSEDVLSPNIMFLIGLAIIFITAAIWHPKEFGCVVHGLLYYIAVPSTFIFLTIYYICNLNIVTWGTREDKKPVQAPPPENVQKKKGRFPAFVKFVSEKILKTKLEQRSEQQTVIPCKIEIEEIKESPVDDNLIKEDKKYWTKVHPFSGFVEEKDSRREDAFWKRILKKYLLPIEGDKSHEERIKDELISLRNNIVFAFFMINFMFSIALLQLQMNREKLIKFYLFGKYEPVSVFFLGIFSILLILQFISMLIHRWGTFQHLVSSTNLLSCRQLSDKEKFKINFRQAKEHIEDPEPDYNGKSGEETNARFGSMSSFSEDQFVETLPNGDVKVDVKITLNNSQSFNENQVADKSRRESLYERRFRKNYMRTVRMHNRTRKPVDPFAVWAPKAFPTMRRNRQNYLEHLYSNTNRTNNVR